jgi:hypothetical protein
VVAIKSQQGEAECIPCIDHVGLGLRHDGVLLEARLRIEEVLDASEGVAVLYLVLQLHDAVYSASAVGGLPGT